MKHLFNCILLMGSFISYSAIADVYEYIDEEGISHLSDIAIDEKYVLILKSEMPIPIDTQSNGMNASQNPEATIIPLNQSQLLAQIEQSAKANQVDSELIHAVIHVESAFKAQAKSNKGAQGLMQLMPATANRLGVKNSYDPAQNIEGGAKYLRELLTLFNNDLSLALAGYNAGENAVIRYGNRIPPYRETQAYVPKVMSIYKALLKQRKQFVENKQVM